MLQIIALPPLISQVQVEGEHHFSTWIDNLQPEILHKSFPKNEIINTNTPGIPAGAVIIYY